MSHRVLVSTLVTSLAFMIGQCSSAHAQTSQWEWVGGTQAIGQTGETPGVYGTLGVPAPGNFPGSRRGAATWTDSSGLWLFGGLGDDSANGPKLLNDLWRFDPSSNQWRWVGGPSTGYQAGIYGTLGTAAPTNIPGGRRSAASWKDSAGNFWLFGGLSLASNAVDYAYLNDLWEYSPSKNQWTWVGGSSSGGATGVYGTLGSTAAANVPGAREGAVSWADTAGNLWLFGGNGYDANGVFGHLNDLWKFQESAGKWTWMAGGNARDVSGIYGSFQSANPSNTPGSRVSAVSWTDGQGNLWLFGGYGRDSTGTAGYLNDVWEFNSSTNQWAWMAGSSTVGGLNGQLGVYHSWITPDAANAPGGRQSATGWTDANGRMWLFGGFGYDSIGAFSYLNDLWMFDPSTKRWTWVDGSQFVTGGSFLANPGTYGTLLTPDVLNTPGGRDGAVSWTDAKGSLWLFGGYASAYQLQQGLDQTVGYLNDLWEFAAPNTGLTPAAAPVFSPAPGQYSSGQAITIADSTPGAKIYFFIDGAASPAEYTSPITITSTQNIEAMAVAQGYANSPVATASYSVLITAAPTLSPAPGTYTSPTSVTIADSTPGAVVYYTTDGSIPTSSSLAYGGPIQVSSTEAIRAIGVAPGLSPSSTTSGTYAIWPSSALNQWAWMGGLNSGVESDVTGISKVPDIGNTPGSREEASSWTDKNGRFWLFGGRSPSLGELNDLWQFDPATKEWVWMSGNGSLVCAEDSSDALQCTSAQPSVYGTKGEAAATDTPGGREGAATWTDANGNLLLFGGHLVPFGGPNKNYEDNDEILNELWEFTPSTGQWRWMGGDKNVDSNCFAVNAGNVVNQCAFPGVYGVLGTPASANTPGSRVDATTWTDGSGNLWLFGGWAWDVSAETKYFFNDLWKFNPGVGQWTWEGGSSTKAGSSCFSSGGDYFPTCGEAGVYGTIGTSSASNNPGGRAGGAGWTDSQGNLWLFGGSAFDANGRFSGLNDLWRFSPSTNQWTWIGGNKIVSGYYTEASSGVYGTLGTPAAGNIPVDRWGAATWTDKAGNFWLFGGVETGWYGNSYDSLLNDLWTYNPTANEWAWMGGAQPKDVFHVNLPGTYGILGTPAPGNIPGGRVQSSSWTANDGSLWLFGGYQFSNLSNDLWEYMPSAPVPVPSFAVVAQSPSIAIQQTSSGSLPINVVTGYGFSSVVALGASNLPSGITASFSPASVTGAGSSQMTIAVDLSVPTAAYAITVVGTSGSTTQTTIVTLTVTSAPPPTFTLTASSALTVSSGSQGALPLTITPKYGFNSPVTFACTGLPVGATCSFSPTTVTPNGSPVTDQLTIVVNKQSAEARFSSNPAFLLGSMVIVLSVSGWKRRRAFHLSVLVIIAIALGLGSLTGCGGGGHAGSGGGGSGSVSTPITTTVTITASGGSVQQIATLALTVD